MAQKRFISLTPLLFAGVRLRIIVPVLDVPGKVADDRPAHRTSLRPVLLLRRPPASRPTVGALRSPPAATASTTTPAHRAVVPVRPALLPAALLSPLVSPLAALLLRLTGA